MVRCELQCREHVRQAGAPPTWRPGQAAGPLASRPWAAARARWPGAADCARARATDARGATRVAAHATVRSARPLAAHIDAALVRVMDAGKALAVAAQAVDAALSEQHDCITQAHKSRHEVNEPVSYTHLTLPTNREV